MALFENAILGLASKFVTERGLASRIRRGLRREQQLEVKLGKIREDYHKAILEQTTEDVGEEFEHYAKLLKAELEILQGVLKKDIEEDKKLLNDIYNVKFELMTHRDRLGGKPHCPLGDITEEDILKRLKNLESNHSFNAHGGKSFNSVVGLLEVLKADTHDETFKTHVGHDFDHFAQWLWDSYHDADLSRLLGGQKERHRYVDALEGYVQWLKWHALDNAIKHVEHTLNELVHLYVKHIDDAIKNIAGMESNSLSNFLQEMVDIPSQLRNAEADVLRARTDLRDWKKVLSQLKHEDDLIGDLEKELSTDGLEAQLWFKLSMKTQDDKTPLAVAARLFDDLGKGLGKTINIYQQVLTRLRDLESKDQEINMLQDVAGMHVAVSVKTLGKPVGEHGLGFPQADAERYDAELKAIITDYVEKIKQILMIERLQESAAMHG